MNTRPDLDTLLRQPVREPAPPTDSTLFAARVMREALREPRPARAPRRGVIWVAAAAALALVAGRRRLPSSAPPREALALLSPPNIPEAAAVLPEAIETAVRTPYDDELARLREDLDRTTRFVAGCVGFDLAGK